MSVSSFVLNLAKDPAQLNKDYQGAGRGIVICGGGSYLPSAYVAIRHVRRTGCSLPIELWVIDWTEIPQEQIEHFHPTRASQLPSKPGPTLNSLRSPGSSLNLASSWSIENDAGKNSN